ncbi:MAG: hypothetical protein LBI62_07185 [Candidatus Accumulibacter sp.]|nr:hypothetical protein [Accumulibacter sp.]
MQFVSAFQGSGIRDQGSDGQGSPQKCISNCGCRGIIPLPGRMWRLGRESLRSRRPLASKWPTLIEKK